MEPIKICPACGEVNPVSEVICRVCMTNLASVSPSAPVENQGDEPSEQGEDAELTLRSPSVLTLSRMSDGHKLMLKSGAVLGRNGEAEGFFKGERTVSRTHARTSLVDGTWLIEDLGSMNGTWVNGARIAPGQAHPLAIGDIVALSLSCEMRVIE